VRPDPESKGPNAVREDSEVQGFYIPEEPRPHVPRALFVGRKSEAEEKLVDHI
jgi:hypothetical protein